MQARREIIRETGVPGETPDPVPVELIGGNERPLTLREEMRRFVRQELSNQARDNGAGTFEEEDDFTDDLEEPDLTSPYTVQELAPDAYVEDYSDLEGKPTAADLKAAEKPSEEHSATPPAEPPVPPGEFDPSD